MSLDSWSSKGDIEGIGDLPQRPKRVFNLPEDNEYILAQYVRAGRLEELADVCNLLLIMAGVHPTWIHDSFKVRFEHSRSEA